MAKPAAVLLQSGGTGVILFSGQTIPAAAIRADALKHLHDLARAAMEYAKLEVADSDRCRSALQELHLEIATLLLDLQDTALRHRASFPAQLRLDSTDFVHFDNPGEC